MVQIGGPRADDVMNALNAEASDSDAVFLQRFFKIAKGEYGEGDQFIGVRVPVTRQICREFASLPIDEIARLLESPIHEHRLAATIIMSGQYRRANATGRQWLYELYLKALSKNQINNWDIVDTSAEHILGAYARKHGTEILFSLCKSNLWSRRAAIVSCFAWLRQGEVGSTLELAEILWPDTHDLMQKAVGWMLRETGKCVDEGFLLDFLDNHAHEMPRTELRYAIERLDSAKRKHYMGAKARIIKE